MLNRNLPELDKKVKIGNTIFTRRECKKKYNPSVDDKRVLNSLKFGSKCIEAHSSDKKDFIVSDSEMADLELAVIAYEDCIPKNHPIKQEYNLEEVSTSLLIARFFYFGKDGPEYIP